MLGKNFVFLLSIIALHRVSPFSNKYVNCDVPGLCNGEDLNSDFVEDKITCWENCLNHVDCLWFSFSSVNQLCILFATCPEIIENPEFISGEKECNYLHEYGRALVTTGYPYGNGIQTEVIDFKNENISCETLPDFPIKLEAATGGLLFNSVPMVCGGLSFDPKLIIHSNCYIVGQEEPITSLNTARYFSASVVLNNSILWVTGGQDVVGNYLRSTELVSMDSTTIGPDLPYEVGIHCMVKMNEETVYIIGGSYFYYVSNRTTIVNPRDNFSMDFGPDLRIGRSYPACGIFEVNNKKIVAVIGGEVGPDENGSSTELWDPNSEDGWILGPDLPLTSCIYGSVVTSPDGKGILLMGCTIDQNGIYELAENSDGDLEWTKLNQQLESPRYGPIVMSIPNNMTLCQRRNELPN